MLMPLLAFFHKRFLIPDVDNEHLNNLDFECYFNEDKEDEDDWNDLLKIIKIID